MGYLEPLFYYSRRCFHALNEKIEKTWDKKNLLTVLWSRGHSNSFMWSFLIVRGEWFRWLKIENVEKEHESLWKKLKEVKDLKFGFFENESF